MLEFIRIKPIQKKLNRCLSLLVEKNVSKASTEIIFASDFSNTISHQIMVIQNWLIYL